MKQSFTLSSREIDRIVFDHLCKEMKLLGKSYDSVSCVRPANRGYEITFTFEEVKKNG